MSKITEIVLGETPGFLNAQIVTPSEGLNEVILHEGIWFSCYCCNDLMWKVNEKFVVSVKYDNTA